MAGDWIKLYRKTQESAVFASDSLFRLWCYCLMEANFKDSWYCPTRSASPVQIKRGSFVTGRYALHAALYPEKRKSDPSPSTVWRMLETLRDLGNLNIETNSSFSVVTVVNYSTYQDVVFQNEQQFEQRLNSGCTTSEQRLNTLEERQELKEGKEEGCLPPIKINFSRVLFPPGFDTDEVRELCVDWANHLRKHGKPALDPEEPLTQAMRLFRTRAAFIHNVRHAIANQYVTIRRYEDPPASDSNGPAPRKTFT